MPKALSPQQVEQCRSRSHVASLPAISAARAAEILARLEAQERAEGGRLSLCTNRRRHLLLVCLAALIRHPRILDAVEDVIGPDIRCRDTCGHFLPQPRPARDFDPEAAAFHARMFDASNHVFYRGAAQVPAEAAPPR